MTTREYNPASMASRMRQRWRNMVNRCTSPSDVGFMDYGGRGIRVCDRWLHSFEAFRADMGDMPTPQHTLDRIDNDGDYTPGNCRWATQQEQRANRRAQQRGARPNELRLRALARLAYDARREGEREYWEAARREWLSLTVRGPAFILDPWEG